MASVFEELRSAESALSRVAEVLEPETLDVTGAKKLVDLATRCERFAVAIRGQAARRVEQAVNWKQDGHPSAAHWLASTTGTSVAGATRSLETARRLEKLRETADAFRSGELSEAQAASIAQTAALDPSAEQRLLDAARRGGSFRKFRDQCREASVRTLVKDPEVRLEGDINALERGYVKPGERMELVGIGPIPVTIARSLLSDARVSILSREGTDITRITSPKRTIPASLRRWVERAYPRCGHLGCGSRERLQIDHIIPVEAHGPTEKDNLWRLCGYHHKLKTFYGWQSVGPEGQRQLIPPDDHPERAPP